MDRKILVLAGQTAVGKTEYAIDLALDFDAEIVSCDSMQIYKYMDIGSAKPTPEEMEKVPHHLVDFADPREDYSVAKYCKLAKEAIAGIFSRGKLPLITGGTGLYINSLIYDMDFGGEIGDPAFRKSMQEVAASKGPLALHAMLKEKDPAAAERLHPNNVKRVIRALEACEMGGSIADFSRAKKKTSDYDVIMMGLFRNRAELYDRINRRVDILMDKGLVTEVKGLMDMGLSASDISMKGIGYKEIIDYLEGNCTLEEAVDTIKKNTRHYAKRQMTWLRGYEDMKWFDLDEYENKDLALEDMKSWLRKRL